MKNIGNDVELLDLVNEKDEVVGTVNRNVAQNDPSKIYRIVSVSIFNKKGETLIQQRAPGKTHPGKWETSISGHVRAGEKPIDTAKRELLEELGISATPKYYDKWFIPGKNKNRFMWIYYLIVPNGINITADKKEVASTIWIKPEDLPKFAQANYWDVKGYSHKEIMKIYDTIKSSL